MSRAPKASARRAATRASDHLERSECWNGLRAGDKVVVSGLAIRGATWEFRAHVLNRHNGSESVEVVGGRPGDRTVRSFEPERIYPVVGRKRPGTRSAAPGGDRLSLAEAPQLPLG